MLALSCLLGVVYYFLLQCSPLLLAAKNGHEKVVEILLEQDEINVNNKSAVGYNCLCEAVARGHR